MRRAHQMLVLSLLILACAVPAVAQQDDLESRARKLETKIMSPCCLGGPVSDHFSGASAEIRREIRQMLAAGQTEQQILDHYVEIHGPQILSSPPPSGFNLTAYLVPVLIFVGGLAGVWLVARRWTGRQTAAEQRAEQSTTPIDPDYAERLRREVQALDR